MSGLKKFVLIGAAGYIAPRHMKAIKDVNGDLVAVLDPHDSVGILDSYFPECRYFREFERFDRFCSMSDDIDYCVICSPNYLHDSHCRFALRIGADAICEKPVVLMERNLDELIEFQEKNKGSIWCILQARLHQSFQNIDILPFNKVYWEYLTPRGKWYDYSWKADISKSGGIETNIACHLFDLSSSLFGKFEEVQKLDRTFIPNTSSGVLSFEKAQLSYIISISKKLKKRLVFINNEEFSFTNGFEDLHTKSYQNILNGNGFTLEDARQGIRACESIRKTYYDYS